jgi:hypothetical protein
MFSRVNQVYNQVHYSIFALDSPLEGIKALREFFPDGEADDLNFVLFSTSGVHGTSRTIEDVEKFLTFGPKNNDPEESIGTDEITFLILRPRMVTINFGVCCPRNLEDIVFLKKLRESSRRAANVIFDFKGFGD